MQNTIQKRTHIIVDHQLCSGNEFSVLSGSFCVSHDLIECFDIQEKVSGPPQIELVNDFTERLEKQKFS